MKGPRPIYYYKSKPSEAKHFEYKKWRDRAMAAVAEIIERKRAAKIVPARAAWPELMTALRPYELEQIEVLVRQGRLRKVEAFNYDAYEIVEQ